MKKNELCAVIKHFYLSKWLAVHIKAKLDEVHGDCTGVEINKFKCGRTSTEDGACSRRLVEVTATDTLTKSTVSLWNTVE